MAVNSEEFDRSLLQAIQEASPDGILVVNADGAMVSYNQRFVELWGIAEYIRHEFPHSAQQIPEPPLLAKALEKLKHPDVFIRRVEELYANPRESDFTEIELIDGRVLERHSKGLFAPNNTYLGRVWFFRDITSRIQIEQALRKSARIDMLTGQMNRAYFLECADIEFERARRFSQPLAVMMVDLDFFKSINDRYGHAAGDHVLQRVCVRWREALRSVDLLGRMGGEEFALVLPQIEREGVETVAKRMCELVSATPFQFESHLIDASISGGAVWVSAEDQSIADSLRRADIALYEAKEQGRNQIRVDH